MRDPWADSGLNLDYTSDTHYRLVDWARWSRGPAPGESKAQGYLRERTDAAADSDEFTYEIEITDKAVARVRAEHKPWYRVLVRFYKGELPPDGVAESLSYTEGFARALIKAAVVRIGQHIADLERERPKKRRRESL